MSETVQRKVAGVDTYVWTTPIPNHPLGHGQMHWAERGDVIDVTPDEAARGEAIVEKGVPALVSVDTVVEAGPDGFAPIGDDQLALMTVAQVQAYLGTVPEAQHDAELDRVLVVENNRAVPRTSVLALHPDFEPDPGDIDPDA